jgi:hypothetical protein
VRPENEGEGRADCFAGGVDTFDGGGDLHEHDQAGDLGRANGPPTMRADDFGRGFGELEK